jgi:hypothetical protein
MFWRDFFQPNAELAHRCRMLFYSVWLCRKTYRLKEDLLYKSVDREHNCFLIWCGKAHTRWHYQPEDKNHMQKAHTYILSFPMVGISDIDDDHACLSMPTYIHIHTCIHTPWKHTYTQAHIHTHMLMWEITFQMALMRGWWCLRMQFICLLAYPCKHTRIFIYVHTHAYKPTRICCTVVNCTVGWKSGLLACVTTTMFNANDLQVFPVAFRRSRQ